jgi:Holliday junction resolvase RusA-like endonuclease
MSAKVLPEVHIQRVPMHVFRVTGMPKGQPRPRAFSRGGRAAVYDPGTAEGWKGDVARACATLEGAGIHQPLSVTLTFYMPRPKSHYRSNGDLKNNVPRFMNTSRPDVDNLAKAVLDALTNIRVWLDDDQVCELIVRKYWEQPNESAPGCVIRITEIREVEF